MLFATEHGVHAEESKARCQSPHQGDEKNPAVRSGVSVIGVSVMVSLCPMVSLCLFPIIPHEI